MRERAVDGALESGRQACARRAWTAAREFLREADAAGRLEPGDLELLATAEFMTGSEQEYLDCLERAHGAYAEAGDGVAAARCAFWVGITLARRTEAARASGWLARAERLLEREGRDCPERGYMLLPEVFRLEAAADWEAAARTAGAAVEIAERFGDRDLFALAVHEQGHVLVRQGRVEQGLGLLDEAMVAATAGELSPIVTGLVYCGVIAGCDEAYELRRAREWTAALTDWCALQPDMVAFTGRCLVHRAEIAERGGAWADALEQARQAAERCAEAGNPVVAAEARYREGEVHRLRGEEQAAEEAYREASRGGWEPQPGLALLRLAQGRADAAAAAIRRVLAETTEPLRRARLLPAEVEIALALGQLGDARRACGELEDTARSRGRGMLGAMAAQARGAVELSAGDPRSALAPLRTALDQWRELDAPYEAARVRLLLGQACGALGDVDGSRMELEAARAELAGLHAAPDLARVDALLGNDCGEPAHGLTARELEVLRLLARGGTNKAIAAELVLSERTVDRHVSNIFAKLGVSSRAAATAHAYEHGLL